MRSHQGHDQKHCPPCVNLIQAQPSTTYSHQLHNILVWLFHNEGRNTPVECHVSKMMQHCHNTIVMLGWLHRPEDKQPPASPISSTQPSRAKKSSQVGIGQKNAGNCFLAALPYCAGSSSSNSSCHNRCSTHPHSWSAELCLDMPQ